MRGNKLDYFKELVIEIRRTEKKRILGYITILIGIGYFLSQLAFQRDRLSVQTLLVGIGLGALFIMTKSVVIMVLYYGFSFLIYDIYQQDRNLVKSTENH